MGNPETPKPSNACILHHPPEDGNDWRLADDGYATCSLCLSKLRDVLRDISVRYQQLDPTPGASGDQGGPRPPGFGSRSPASDHIIAMRDDRSKSHEVAKDGVVYTWDPEVDNGPDHPRGAYTSKREVWFGSDGRPHSESSNPTRSIPSTLSSWANMVAEDRGMDSPSGGVVELAVWLDRQLDYITRQDWVKDIADDLRKLLAQLKVATGDPPRRHIGFCPNTPEGAPTCGARLYAPFQGDTIFCTECEAKWPRSRWLLLGGILDGES